MRVEMSCVLRDTIATSLGDENEFVYRLQSSPGPVRDRDGSLQ